MTQQKSQPESVHPARVGYERQLDDVIEPISLVAVPMLSDAELDDIHQRLTESDR